VNTTKANPFNTAATGSVVVWYLASCLAFQSFGTLYTPRQKVLDAARKILLLFVELDSRRIAFRDCEVEGRRRGIGLAFGDTLRSLKSTYLSHGLHVFSLVGRPSLLQRCASWVALACCNGAPDPKFQGKRRYVRRFAVPHCTPIPK
jgi:hypothetical protein